MATSDLGSAHIIDRGAADVGRSRERARRRRLLKLLVVLAPLAAWLWVRWLSGNPVAPGLPSLPADAMLWLPGIALVVILGVVLVLPMLGTGRSPHVVFRPDQIDVTLDDVKGLDVVKEEAVRTLNLFLGYATFQDQLGGNPRRGVLFEGPPGTGKTYLAKAMAKEAGVPFLFASATAFHSSWQGATARKLRSFFKALRKTARQEGGAIGFIEEVDAIGFSRSGVSRAVPGAGATSTSTPDTPGGTRVDAATGPGDLGSAINELLVQMQSFDSPTWRGKVAGAFIERLNRFLPDGRGLRRPRPPYANVLLIAATNRADSLDPALLRPGRFDRIIHFDPPSLTGRRDIIDFYLGSKAHDSALDDPARRQQLAAMTMGYTPVMIEHLLNEALVWALRDGRVTLDWADVNRAKLTEEIGVAHPVSYTAAERRAIATHEAGHAVVAWLVGRGRRLEILSIVKRRAALGLLGHSDSEERWTKTRSELVALLQISFGGMAAEELFFGESGTGVSGDLQAATTLAAQMVGACGMGSSLVSLEAAGSAVDQNLVQKVLADEALRADVDGLLTEEKDSVAGLLAGNVHLVEALRDALLDREELVGDEITDILATAQADVVDVRAPAERD